VIAAVVATTLSVMIMQLMVVIQVNTALLMGNVLSATLQDVRIVQMVKVMLTDLAWNVPMVITKTMMATALIATCLAVPHALWNPVPPQLITLILAKSAWTVTT
jgi:hypothetical protein